MLLGLVHLTQSIADLMLEQLTLLFLIERLEEAVDGLKTGNCAQTPKSTGSRGYWLGLVAKGG